MSRYIDAEWLKGQINTTFWAEIGKIIDSAPSIDIVFCKECKYRDKHHYCGIWGQPYLCNDECFCSYGERREP